MANRYGGAGLHSIRHFDMAEGGTVGPFAGAMQMVQTPQTATATFGTASATSSTIDLRGYGPRGLAVAVGTVWTSSQIEFDVSPDNSTWYPLRDKTGGTVAISGIGTVSAAIYAAPSDCWMVGAFSHLRMRCTSGGTAFAQATAQTVTVAFLG